MRWLLPLFILAACSETAPPETVVPIADAAPHPRLCGPTRVIAHALLDNFGERPIATGDKDYPNMVLTYGPKSWTLIELDGKGNACLVAAGSPLESAQNDKGE